MSPFFVFDEVDPLQACIDRFFDFNISGPLITSLTIMLIVAILAIIIGIKARRADPLKRPKGILLLAEIYVDWLDNWTEANMGVKTKYWAGYFMGLFSYLFLAFIWSITGLPSVMDYLVVPFSLSLVMFVLIQFTALRYQKWGYFHRYVEPLKIWLPLNLITMWTPIVSTSLRMFGNALAGSAVIGLVNWALKNVSSMLFSFLGEAGSMALSPIPIAVLNLYFALFSGFIQTLVFASLNAVWIGQEMPSTDAMGTASQATRGEAQ